MNLKISTVLGMVVVILVAATANYLIWQKVNEEKFQCIDSLKKAFSRGKSVPKIEKKIESENVCESKTDSEIALPVVRFIPGGLFSDKEKEGLMEMVINPFVDFEEDSYAKNRIISIAVNKYSDSELAQMQNPKYIYNISAIYEEGHGGWLERELGEGIDWWVPDCLDACDFSEDFAAKYPKIIEKYNEMQNPIE